MNKVSDIYKKHPFAFIIGPSLKAIEAFFDLMIPLIMKAIIDLTKYDNPKDIPNPLSSFVASFLRLFGNVSNNQSLSDAIIGGIIILILGVIGFIITMVTQYIAARTCVKVGTELRDNLYQHILSFWCWSVSVRSARMMLARML